MSDLSYSYSQACFKGTRHIVFVQCLCIITDNVTWNCRNLFYFTLSALLTVNLWSLEAIGFINYTIGFIMTETLCSYSFQIGTFDNINGL